MGKLFLVALIMATTHGWAQEADIKSSINTFFAGLHTADTLKIKTVCSDVLVLHSIMEGDRGTKFTKEPAAEFYRSIASIPKDLKIEERLLEYKILVDGPMAHAWTPYEFYINGKMSHSGVNSFQLYKDNGIWKIVYIIDTRKAAK